MASLRCRDRPGVGPRPRRSVARADVAGSTRAAPSTRTYSRRPREGLPSSRGGGTRPRGGLSRVKRSRLQGRTLGPANLYTRSRERTDGAGLRACAAAAPPPRGRVQDKPNARVDRDPLGSTVSLGDSRGTRWTNGKVHASARASRHNAASRHLHHFSFDVAGERLRRTASRPRARPVEPAPMRVPCRSREDPQQTNRRRQSDDPRRPDRAAHPVHVQVRSHGRCSAALLLIQTRLLTESVILQVPLFVVRQPPSPGAWQWHHRSVPSP
jgi:hypothetical protein